jgi:ubiquitin thioesterase OTU1
MICAVDIQTLRINAFGEDGGYPTAAFLLYDGIHYDPLVLDEAATGSALPSPSYARQCVREGLQAASEAVLQLATELNQQRQFTDVAGFSLRCLVCNTVLRGEKEAQAHAKATAHTNFGEL